MIVDERWILLGSANLDPRSFRLNFEFNLEAYEPTLAGELCRWLDDQTSMTEPVTLEEIDARPDAVFSRLSEVADFIASGSTSS